MAVDRSLGSAFALMSSLVLLPGCSDPVLVPDGEDPGDGGRPPPTGPRDECGNGQDDDGDRRIDEGCPCAEGETQTCFTGGAEEREVGACADGLQRCEVSSLSEFGAWGACEGDTPPGDERCDGVDGDCDGAVDEGCPCTNGATQPCGVEFLIEPCTGGTQVCRGGSWSGCEGAIRPEPEVCGDGIDNDCDGEGDELCDCVPEPEVCGDGVDNDCDGERDEPGCEGEGCVPEPEICDGADNDCDGTADEDCGGECTCEVSDFTPLGEGFRRPDGEWGGPIATHQMTAHNATRSEVASIFRIDHPAASYVLQRAALDGTPIARGTIPWVDPDDIRLHRMVKDMVWTGEHYAVLMDPPEETFGGTELLLLGEDGAPVGSSVRLRNHEGGTAIGVDLLMVDGVLHVLSTSGCLTTEAGSVWPRCIRSYMYLDRYDAMLRPIGSRVFVVGDPEAVGVEGTGVMMAGAGRIAIFHRRFLHYETGESGTTLRLTVIEDDEVVSRSDFLLSHSWMMAVITGLAFDGRRFLGCYGFGTGTISLRGGAVGCRLFETDGTPVGTDFFDATPRSESYYENAFGVAFTGCRFVVSTYQFDCGPSGCTENHHVGFIDPMSGAVEMQTVAAPASAVRPWTVFLLPRGDEGLLRVTTEWLYRPITDHSAAIDVQQLARTVTCSAD